MIKLIAVGMVALAAFLATGVLAQPVINDGEAPQVGHDRVYGQSVV